MIEIKRKGKIEFGIWKYLQKANNQISPVFACVQPIENGALINQSHDHIVDVGDCTVMPSQPIGCEGATHEAIVNTITYNGMYSVMVDGQHVGNMTGQQMTETTFANENVMFLLAENPDSWDFPLGHFRNNGPDFVRFEVIAVDAESFSGHHEDPPNESLVIGAADGTEGRKVTFCLAPSP